MRLSTLVGATLLPVSLVSALSAKATSWANLAHKSQGVLKLDSNSYEELLSGTSGERDYAVTVLLTAMGDEFKCSPCREFDPSFRHAAASWDRLPKEQRSSHIFASLDFKEGQAIYKKLQLQSAPTVWFHPPTQDGASKTIPYDLNQRGFKAEPLVAFLQPHLDYPFKLHIPFPWGIALTIPPFIALALYTLWVSRAMILPIVQSPVLWQAVVLGTILTFTTGYMWNRIRGAPYTQMDRQGRVSWMAGGFQNQFGAESQVIAGVYGALAFSVIALIDLVPRLNHPTRQKAGVALWTLILIVIFSILMNLFRVKNGSYPFKLLF